MKAHIKIERSHMHFDPEIVKQDFPALMQDVRGKPLAFLDTAASAQKPQMVIERMSSVMQEHYANVHRGLYDYSQKTTLAFEQARKTVANFVHADRENEIIFTRNATEAINLVAATWGQGLKAGDEIIISALEHHANIVPWHFLVEKYGAVLKQIPLLGNGMLDMDAYAAMLSDKTKMVAVTHMSNAIGTINNVQKMTEMAKSVGATVLIDGSQAVVHMPVDVQAIGCDFYVFTGHKLYGPTGIGVLWGKYDMLMELPPYQGGGEMIDKVSMTEVTYKKPPHRFEAGTPAIIEAIGLGAAIEYMMQYDVSEVQTHEHSLMMQAIHETKDIAGLNLHTATEDFGAIFSFTMDDIHVHDIGTILDQMGVAVRAGHHCAQPLMEALNVQATVRASFAMYNTVEDVTQFAEALRKVKNIFG